MTNPTLSLPSGCHLRIAVAEDQWRIRKLVLKAKLDPTQVRWQQFWVIEYEGQLVACGQLRNFKDAQELGSLVVEKSWHGKGLGSFLTQHLTKEAKQPLYLECLGERLAQFYSRLGFIPIRWQALPPSLKLKFGISQLARILLRVPVYLMYYQPS